MLARQYDNYAWEEEVIVQRPRVEQPPAPRRKEKTDAQGLLLRQIVVICGIVMLTYFVCVVRSVAYVSAGKELVSLRSQERQLVNSNNELKIEVEELKGPDRIIGLAQQRLGMRVARSNIYVKGSL